MTCKSVAYLRVSTEGQAKNGHGLRIQERAVRAWAKKNGHQVVAICADEGLSGTLDAQERPGLLCALDMVRSGEATALLVPSLDRLGRTLTTQEAALGLVWRAGGRIYSADEGEILEDDPEDPMRTAIRQMRGVMHQLDKALISKRLRAGRRIKSEEHGYVGGIPRFGYAARDGRLVPDETEQAVLARVRALASQGDGLRAIARTLNEEGRKTKRGGSWQATQVARVLSA